MSEIERLALLKQKHTEMFHKTAEDSGLKGEELKAYKLGLADGILLTTRIINDLSKIEDEIN